MSLSSARLIQSTHCHPVCLRHGIHLPPTPIQAKQFLSLRFPTPKPCKHFSSAPCIPHALSISSSWLINLIIYTVNIINCATSHYAVLSNPITSTLLGPDTVLKQPQSLHLNVTKQFSHSHKRQSLNQRFSIFLVPQHT